ncbi:MAG TPA: pyridoxamine 5'-phosphate oxidase family protein [Acidimicrobiales bacterium]|nr:pyridoxamine 5'-phosphate oxidase family protein [Acidimicrobiales bacterium]
MSKRSTLRRKRERGSYERDVIDAILDEGLVCHVGFVDEGSTFVVPMTYARVEDVLYLHGAAANHLLKSSTGCEACVTVTLLDGLVLARSAFHHSMNYRSVMLFGTGERVDDPEEKRAAVLAIVDHMAPGRSRDARPPTESELRSTQVVRFAVHEGSAKVRTGGPIEEPDDLGLRIWAGQIPIDLVAGPPMADPSLPEGVSAPAYVASYPPRRRTAPYQRATTGDVSSRPSAGG